MSDNDFNGRLLAPVMTRPRRPLSNRASTASCNMRFSLRTMGTTNWVVDLIDHDPFVERITRNVLDRYLGS